MLMCVKREKVRGTSTKIKSEKGFTRTWSGRGSGRGIHLSQL